MDCYLKKELKEEHANMKNPKLESVVFMCPVLSRQICMWCCLHIRDVSNPMSRNYAIDHHPKYAIKAAELSGRSLDSIWETCARCHNVQA